MSVVRYIATCPACAEPRAIDTTGPFGEVDGMPFARHLFENPIRCRGCQTALGAAQFHRLAGTYSAAHACDPRCTSASGPVCVCSCAGANHGARWR